MQKWPIEHITDRCFKGRHTLEDILRGREARKSPACIRTGRMLGTVQAGTQEVDIGSFLCCMQE